MRPLRQALREASALPVPESAIVDCLDLANPADALFERARLQGLFAFPIDQRRSPARVTGEVAESVAEVLLADIGLSVFSQITTPGIHGVDLLLLSPEESVLALEVKGTLRAGSIPRLTPSRLRQMSREWLNSPDNPAMIEWGLEADDLYAGVMVVDLATPTARVAVSGDFMSYQPLAGLAALQKLSGLLIATATGD